jgi:hypothetical protein
MNLLKKLTLGAALSFGLMSQAQAGLLTYSFTGTVQGTSAFDSLFSVGDTGQYVVTFDTSSTNLTYMSLSVGSTILATSNQGSYYAGNWSWQYPSGSILQPYTTSGFNSSPVLGYVPYQVQGNLWSTTSSIFAAGLPTTAFSLDPFNYHNGVVANFTQSMTCTSDNYYFVDGCYPWTDGQVVQVWAPGQFNMQFTAVAVNEGAAVTSSSGVPAPGALVLLGLGLLGLGGLRRRRAA